ncbi:putative nuclease HARBI1 [Teleopsis dalmanni]|uniref:putative nuclease HARBI1 n=1 Tax=Teleopsis dalmanni TaxID=139649 RepID=UPI0018CD4CF2|nr:putative nuclease HARBI1 [Teleopsis dalmanni]
MRAIMKSEAIALMVIATCLEERKNKRKRRIWAKTWLQKREKFSHVKLLKELETSCIGDLKNFLRMDNNNYTELLSMVQPLIIKQDTFMRDAISPHERLSATLRFLASGGTFQDLKFLTGISPHSLSNIVIETCNAIRTTLKEYIQIPKNEQQWKSIAKGFETQWNFPNCIGAIDGKHVAIKKPPGTGSYYYNYKKSFSIVLMAVVNSNYEFIAVDVGANGRASDAGMFSKTKFKQKLDEDELAIPNPDAIPFNENMFPFVFIGDDAFPLLENLMKPYSHTNISDEEHVFNYRLSRARRVVENAFGILASRFRVLANKINLDPHKTAVIAMTCCYLHNFLMSKNRRHYLRDSVDIENTQTAELQPAHWRSCSQLPKLQALRGGNSSNTAKDVRSMYKNYFNGEGAVPWQYEHVTSLTRSIYKRGNSEI